MPQDERKDIAGFGPKHNRMVDWGYFGGMSGAIPFKKAVMDGNPLLCQALDVIPIEGLVTRHEYEQFVEMFHRAFPNGGDGVAVATRLLAIKRPDMFVCLARKNRKNLCEAFGIKPSDMTYTRYWDEIVERVRLATWWNAPAPADQADMQIWLGRTAFLDSLFYDPAL
jgi:hypothetical protein